MAHNVQTFAEREGNGTYFKAGTEIGDAPVLTINGFENREVVFYTPRVRGEKNLVINPWEEGRTVTIFGEDLFALREFLNNELPEDAFVRPADPVAESFCFFDRDGDVWAYIEGYGWACDDTGDIAARIRFAESGRGLGGYPDFEDFEEVVESHGIIDGPPPTPWQDGDVVLYDGGNSVYTRVDGSWQRIRVAKPGPYITERRLPDIEIDEVAAKAPYRVLRRGGVDL